MEWKKAYELLAAANHVRIIGYSLPNTDSYVRYLFKASILRSENLKRIDVICLDELGSVKDNYDSFITWKSPKYNFYSVDVTNYLQNMRGSIYSGHKFFCERQDKVKRGLGVLTND